MVVSDRVDAEFINRAVFKITDKMYTSYALYKAGLILLSSEDQEFRNQVKCIDLIQEIIDGHILAHDMKKALIYTALLKKRVNKLVKTISETSIRKQ